jgi:hypothetical protein
VFVTNPTPPLGRFAAEAIVLDFVPGAVLFTILGIGPLGAAVLAWRRHAVAPSLTFVVGGALVIWLIVEIVFVCRELSFLGVELLEEQNAIHGPLISRAMTRVHVRVIPTNEALMMAREAYSVLTQSASAA